MDQETQAFPKPTPGTPGMTLRDYFAAKAMQALLSNPDALSAAIDASADQPVEREVIMSVMAYLVADAMIETRGAK